MKPASAIALGVNRGALRLAARTRNFLQRRPLVAKACPTAFGFAFGDFLTQYLNRPHKNTYQHDPTLTAAMAATGAVVAAPVGLALYRWMDLVWPGTSWLLAAGKFTLDQVVGCVIWQAAYISICESYRHRLQQGLDHLLLQTCRTNAAAVAAAQARAQQAHGAVAVAVA